MVLFVGVNIKSSLTVIGGNIITRPLVYCLKQSVQNCTEGCF